MSRRESRRRRRSFRYKFRRFIKGLRESLYYAYKKVRNFFRKALPARNPGEPIWKSRRLIVGVVSGILCVGIELLVDWYLYEKIIFRWSAIVATVCIIIDAAIITLLSMRRFRNAIRRRFHF